jgi:uncharacterized membrane protein YcfT
MTASRIGWVDYAKGICIILVVMMHSVHRVEGLLGAEGFLSPVVDFAQPFRMPDFFLISGLFLSRSLFGPVNEYIDRKVIHFIYFYVLWLTIQLMAFETSVLLNSPMEFIKLWLIGLIEPTGTLWFVHMLLIFYVVTWLLRRAPVLLVFAGALMLQSASQLGWIETGWAVPDRFAERYVYFFAGYAFAPAIFAFASRAAASVPLAVAGLAVWAGVNQLCVSQGVHGALGVSLVLGMMGAAAVCTIAALLVRFEWAKVLQYCGRHSIVIYLTFPIPLTAMIKLIENAEVPSDMAGIASFVALLVAIVAPLVFHRLILNTPLQALYLRPAWAKLRFVRARSLRAPA